MFLRIFRYRVKPQMRDRHLALQARSAQLYGKYVGQPPKYFRRSGDANSWVELHWYADKAECQQVAQSVADDFELARLWREFQETLDPDQPPTLEEFGEYELPRPVNASPFSQPPIDDVAQPSPPVKPAAKPAEKPIAKPLDAEIVEEPDQEPSARPANIAEPIAKHSSDNGDGHGDEHSDEHRHENAPDAKPAAHPNWPSPPLPTEKSTDRSADPQTDDLVIEDDPPAEPRDNSLSFNDGVWIVEPEPRPRRDDG